MFLMASLGMPSSSARRVALPAIDLITTACALRRDSALESSDADSNFLATSNEPTNQEPAVLLATLGGRRP